VHSKGRKERSQGRGGNSRQRRWGIHNLNFTTSSAKRGRGNNNSSMSSQKKKSLLNVGKDGVAAGLQESRKGKRPPFGKLAGNGQGGGEKRGGSGDGGPRK